jgi:hypothetical protein
MSKLAEEQHSTLQTDQLSLLLFSFAAVVIFITTSGPITSQEEKLL